jgi:glycosyltransferase involved in cell wall biosynthesis
MSLSDPIPSRDLPQSDIGFRPSRVLNRRRLRIEMVIPTLDAAGMEMIVARLMRGLARQGQDVGVTCILAGGVVADELRSEGYRVSVVATPGLRSILYPTRLADSLRRLEPTIVHVHSGAWLKAARAARMAGVPYIVHTMHGTEGNEPWFTKARALWRLAAHYTDAIVAVSEPLVTYLHRDKGLAREKLRVIPNGVDTETFRPAPSSGVLRTRLGVGAKGLLIGNVARLAPVKNHALLFEAFAILRRHVPEATLAVVGEGPLRQDLERRIAALRLESHAHLAGLAGNMPEVYREFDLFVLSSRLEGTSVSILEAMASGVCVVATAVGGNPDLLGHGRFGVLVAPDDPSALAAAMADLLRDPTRRRMLAAAAREHVNRSYGEESMLQRYQELYYGLSPRRG